VRPKPPTPRKKNGEKRPKTFGIGSRRGLDRPRSFRDDLLGTADFDVGTGGDQDPYNFVSPEVVNLPCSTGILR
jgi:hypothetical protein